MQNFGPTHPIWAIIRTALMLVALTVILRMTASNFDSTEVRVIIGMFLASAGSESVVQQVVKAIKGKSE